MFSVKYSDHEKLFFEAFPRPARGGGQGEQNTWGPDWFGGPEILIKHLVIALLSRGLGARNA